VAPRVLGIDEHRREILTFIEGHVPPDLATCSDEQLVRATELIGRFHDATSGSALTGEEEVVCHNDLSPCNTVFVKGMPSAFIDFDEAAPGSRSQDLGSTRCGCFWIPVLRTSTSTRKGGGYA
jgi:Ser/Thr protein kinase RdoA (MazF antagonist)